MKKIILFSILFLFLSVGIYGYTVTRTTPSQYAVSTTAGVLFNISCLTPSGDSSTLMNASILWKTNRTGAYLNETFLGLATNNTGIATTITFTDEDRIWWKGSCYDMFGEFAVVNESSTLVNNIVNSTYTIPAQNATFDLTGAEYLILNAVGFVNDTGGAYRLLVEDTDYNISANIVTNLNESLVGNTSIWSFNRHIDLINDTYKLQNVTGFVNDTGGAYRTMLLNHDYIISDGLIYTANSSLNGNVTKWTYSWPASVLNQVNTTERVMDIDTDYYTLSFGGGKKINMTLNMGNILITGNYSSQGKLGLTGNYSIGPCYMTYAGGILWATNCTAI